MACLWCSGVLLQAAGSCAGRRPAWCPSPAVLSWQRRQARAATAAAAAVAACLTHSDASRLGSAAAAACWRAVAACASGARCMGECTGCLAWRWRSLVWSCVRSRQCAGSSCWSPGTACCGSFLRHRRCATRWPCLWLPVSCGCSSWQQACAACGGWLLLCSTGIRCARLRGLLCMSVGHRLPVLCHMPHVTLHGMLFCFVCLVCLGSCHCACSRRGVRCSKVYSAVVWAATPQGSTQCCSGWFPLPGGVGRGGWAGAAGLDGWAWVDGWLGSGRGCGRQLGTGREGWVCQGLFWGGPGGRTLHWGSAVIFSNCLFC